MKTLELKLKKDVLIVEIPRLADYEFINKECKYLKVGNEEIKLNASTLDKFEFLCKGSELTEEIASELVNETIMYEKNKVKCYRYISYKEGFVGFDNAKESFISAVESKEKFWLENPIEKPINYDLWAKYGDYTQYGKVLTEKCLKWKESEEKTFKNPLIFVNEKYSISQ